MQIDSRTRDQNFWEVGAVLGSGMGLPVMIVGGSIAKTEGLGTAILSIVIGNIILWMIGLAITSMAKSQHNAIQNISEYLGKFAGILSAILFLFAILIWYGLQLKAAVVTITTNHPENSMWLWGAVLGLIVSLLGIGGMPLIKRIVIFSLPILFIFLLFGIFTSKYQNLLNQSWNISISGILLVIIIWLPGIVSLPTFFRHARSKTDAFLSLSFMTLIRSCFQIFMAILGIDTIEAFSCKCWSDNPIIVQSIFTTLFGILSMISVNLINLYFLSAPLQFLFPKYRSNSQFFLLGILGTFFYILFNHIITQSTSNLSTLAFLEQVSDSFIISLGVVLIIDLIIKIFVRHRPRSLERFLSTTCWLACCAIALAIQFNDRSNSNVPLISAGIAILLFIIILFIEETIWAAKSLNRKRQIIPK